MYKNKINAFHLSRGVALFCALVLIILRIAANYNTVLYRYKDWFLVAGMIALGNYLTSLITESLYQVRNIRISNSMITYIEEPDSEIPETGTTSLLEVNVRGQVYRILQPLPITYMQEKDSSWLVVDNIFDEYGIGVTKERAEEDMLISLVEYMSILQDRQRSEDEAALSRLVKYLAKSNE